MESAIKRFAVIHQEGQYKLLDTKTNKEVTPDCGKDMVDMLAYYRGTGELDQAYNLLEAIINGESPITDMKNRAGAHTA